MVLTAKSFAENETYWFFNEKQIFEKSTNLNDFAQ